MGIGFLLSFIINKEYVYLYAAVVLLIIGVILNIINSIKNKK